MLAKRQAITGGQAIEIVDCSGILFAIGLIDADEFVTLRIVEGWLGLARRARGIADGYVGQLWSQILAGTRGGRARAAGARVNRTAADAAWEKLLALRAAFDELDLLPALELVIIIVGGERGPQTRSELAALKTGIAGIAAWLRHGRRDRAHVRQAIG